MARSQRGEVSEEKQRAIIEMATTILIYKFTHLSRKEVEAMLGITEVKLEDTQFYQDVKAEGVQEGRREERTSLILLMLNQKFGALDERLQTPLMLLDSEQLEALAVSLFNLAELTDFETWLTSALGDGLVGKLTEKFESCSEELAEQVRGASLEKLTKLSQHLDELATLQAVEQQLNEQ